jgi:hypothetical protein
MVLSYLGEGGACRQRHPAEMKTTVWVVFWIWWNVFQHYLKSPGKKIHPITFDLFFFFLIFLGLELRALTLARQVLCHLSHTVSLSLPFLRTTEWPQLKCRFLIAYLHCGIQNCINELHITLVIDWILYNLKIHMLNPKSLRDDGWR